jgi:hypothetical protein
MSLNYIKCLLTFDNDYNNNKTNYWVKNVAPTGIFVKADNMDNWTIGDSGIPTGWVVYTETEWRLRNAETQSDWNESNDNSIAYIRNKPTISQIAE